VNDRRDTPDAAGSRIALALQWAIEATGDPALAAADWLARDLSPRHAGAFALLADPSASLDELRRAKTVFKTMRVMGETPADRDLAARLYAATIAAALVHHGERISTQNDASVIRALSSLELDAALPDSIRHVASLALQRLQRGSITPRGEA
jgi:hypothetical protein